MKALVKSRATRGLWLEDVPEPEPGINDVKIRVLCTGICGTDLHIYDWNDWARATIPVPLVIGHEFAGVPDQLRRQIAQHYAAEGSRTAARSSDRKRDERIHRELAALTSASTTSRRR